MSQECTCYKLEEIDEFYSILDFERFYKYIHELLKDEYLEEIPVEKKFAGFPEQWYKCTQCQQVWRLVYPDFPFKGIWKMV